MQSLLTPFLRKFGAKLQKNAHLCKKNAKKFGHVKKKQYFCTRFLIEGTCCLRKRGSLVAFEISHWLLAIGY